MALMLSKTYTAGFENRLLRLEIMTALILAGVTSLIVKSFS